MKEEKIELVDQIMTALQKVIDPELQVDIVNLGLIYGIDIEGTKATVKMTLTISGCPLSTYLQDHIKQAVLTVNGIDSCQVRLVWYPVWSPERMTEAAKKQLGMLDDQSEKDEIEKTEEKQKIIDFSGISLSGYRITCLKSHLLSDQWLSIVYLFARPH